MLPGWDKLQDLRGQIAGKAEPAKLDTPDNIKREVDMRIASAHTERTIEKSKQLDAILSEGIKEGKKMSLLGKMQHLTETASQFTTETEEVFDGIIEKIAAARKKRDVAKEKHHGYYDGIIKGVDESVTVIDRLSNAPLDGDGKA